MTRRSNMPRRARLLPAHTRPQLGLRISRASVAILCTATLISSSCGGGGSAGEPPPDALDPNFEIGRDDARQDAETNWQSELETLRNTPVQLAPSAPVGALPGQVWVDDAGGGHYAIPIDVAPGPNGHQPELSLQYSSHGGNGLYGVGFSVGAASSVARCPRTMAKDGYYEALTLGQFDPICYGGQRLILSSGTYGLHGSEYRLESDPSKRFRYEGHPGLQNETYPGEWHLDTADGQTFHFEALDGARDRWHLVSVEDTFSNRIEYNWTIEPDHEVVLSSIAYGGTGTAASQRKVIFNTVTRTDVREGYVRGELRRRTKLVDEIRSEGPHGELLARYALTYDAHPDTRQSILTSVTKFDGGGVALPPTTFSWQRDHATPIETQGADGFVQKSHIAAFRSIPALRRSGMTAIGDFNGDGQSDILSFDPNDNEYKVDGAPALLTAGPEFLPGGWGALDVGTGLHRIQQSPGVMRIKFSAEDARDQLLVPVDSTTVGDDGRDAWGVSTASVLWVAVPTSDWLSSSGPGELQFDYVHYPMSEPVYSVVPLEYNGDGRDDLLLCQGQGYKSSHWVLGLTHDVANTPGGSYGWNFFDTGVGCSTHDEYTVIPHERGTEVLAVIPRFETDPALMQYPADFVDGNGDPDPAAYQAGVLPIAEASRGNYRVLEFDPALGPGTGTLGAEVLERDLYQRWTDLNCNNGFVANDQNGAPLLGAGLSRDRGIDVDGDGNLDIVRFELSGGDDFGALADIQAEALDNGSGYSSDIQCSPSAGQDGVLRVYRNTGDGYVPMATPAFTFAGSPHANLWINWYGGQLRDWNADGLLDIVLPSDGVEDDPTNPDEDWTVLLSQGDGTFLPLDMVHSGASPDWPHYLDGDAVQAIADDNASSRSFAATERTGARSWINTQIFLRPDEFPEYWESRQSAGVRLEQATDGYGLVDTFEYDRSPHGRSIVAARTRNIPTDAPHPAPTTRSWAYEYSEPVLDAYGIAEVGFSWVRETLEELSVGSPHGARTQRRFYDWTYDASVRSYPYAGTPEMVESAWVSNEGEPNEAWHIQCRELESWSLETQALLGGQIWQSYPDLSSSYALTRSPSTNGVSPSGYNYLQPGHPTGPGDLSQCGQYSTSDYELHSTMAYTRDDYGNVIESTSEALVGVSETTTLTTTYEEFDYDPAAWEIASPELVTTQSCVGGECKTRQARAWYSTSDRNILESVHRELGTPFEQGVTFQYDAHGNVTTSTVSAPGEDARAETTEWTAEGVSPLRTTNALGHVTNFVLHEASGALVATVDPNGFTQKSSYDGFFRPVAGSFHASPLGLSDGADSSVTYAPGTVPGTVLDVTTLQQGHESVASYDRAGRLVRQQWHGVEAANTFPVPTTLEGPETCTWHEYDVFGDRLASSEPTSCSAPPSSAEAWARHDYDVGGRLRASRWYDDGVEVAVTAEHTDYEWSGFTAVPGLAEVNGHAVQITDPDGHATTRVTDGLGRLSATVDALGTMTCFDYGPFGELRGVHRNCEYGASGTMESSAFQHDAISRLVASTEPARGIESYTYTGFDEPETITDAKGQVIEHEFDRLGRLRVRHSPECVARWSYDGPLVGALGYQLSEDGVKETFAYDAFGRVERVEHDVPGVNPSGPWVFEFDFDNLGRLSSLTYPDAPAAPLQGTSTTGFAATFHYDGSNNLRSIQGAGRTLWALNDADAAGFPLEESFNVNHAFAAQRKLSAYHRFTQRADEIRVRANDADVQHFSYDWTPGGDLEERREFTTSQSESFGYDELHRLVSIDGAQAASYDALGNFTHRAGVGSYDYDAATGRLNWYGSAANSVTHDANGNVEAIGDISIDWTPFDKVRELSRLGENLTFAYDINGSRAARFDDAGFTLTLGGLFEYSSQDDVQSGTTDLQARYFVPAGGAVIEVRDEVEQGAGAWSRQVLYQYDDHLGSGSVQLQDDGTVAERASFDAWGQAREWEGWAKSLDPAVLETLSSGFTGHQPELDLGLINMRGRMYSPTLGRFLSADPVVEAMGDAQTWNAYSYVLNNPLRYVDPSGFSAAPPILGPVGCEPLEACLPPGGGGDGTTTTGGGSTGGGSTGGGSTGDGSRGSVPQSVPGQSGVPSGNTDSHAAHNAGGGGGKSEAGGNKSKSNGRGQATPPQRDFDGLWEGPEGRTDIPFFLDQEFWEEVKRRLTDPTTLEVIGDLAQYVSELEYEDVAGAGHLVLDGLGAAPHPASMIADAANGVWYAGEGDWFSASASFGAIFVVGGVGLVAKGGAKVVKGAGQGYRSFRALKRALGPAGPGKAWHHIVEQTPANVAKFGAEAIHNTANIVKVPHGKGSVHAKISGYYSSKQPFTDGQTVRQWLSGKSFDEQAAFGRKVLKMFGGSP